MHNNLHQTNSSLWIGTTPYTSYPVFEGQAQTDVVVIGAGITGLTAALLLKRAGLQVMVLEADKICSGVTAYTTAKFTSLHELIYAQLESKFGQETAQIFAEANQTAIEQVAGFVQEYSMDCDFQRLPAITYTEDPDGIQDIEREVEAAQRAGLPAYFTTQTDLPYPIQAAVQVDNQVQLHPRKYCLALASAFGGGIYEFSRVLNIETDENGCTVKTANGAITALYAVMATQLPFQDKGGFFAKTYPSRSYLMAVRLQPDQPVPQGMYISTNQPGRTLRPANEYLLVGGENHKVGQDSDTRRHYEAIAAWAKERFAVASIDYQWSAQDYMPVDGLPYIGYMPFSSERIFVATGYAKWGMTRGTFAAMIIRDLILRQSNSWAEYFAANRMDILEGVKDFIVENTNVARRFVGDRLKSLAVPDATNLSEGEGGLVYLNGETVAAYRDEEGTLHAVSPTCTHLGCMVRWNTAEKSWDCPCHGSRFTTEGRIIQGPALKPLEKKT